jgi:Trk K+ transport system NAD-binding subunit
MVVALAITPADRLVCLRVGIWLKIIFLLPELLVIQTLERLLRSPNKIDEVSMLKNEHYLLSPSERCKALGLTLAQVSRVSGTSVQTLINWHKNKPWLFDVVLAGVKALS